MFLNAKSVNRETRIVTAWLVSCTFAVSAVASEAPTLNVLVPLGTLPFTLVKSFEKRTGTPVRVGFLGRARDSGPRVRQDALVWDVILSSTYEIGKLEQSGQLLGQASETGASRALFWDPIGLSCKLPSRFKGKLELSWSELSKKMIEANLFGEVVFDLAIPIQVALAGRMVTDDPKQAFAPLEAPAPKAAIDPRWAWLKDFYWKARPAVMAIDTEIFRDQVSCVVTFLSRHRNLSRLFESRSESLEFVIPDKKTVASVFTVALTQETARPELSSDFANHLVKGLPAIIKHTQLCAMAKTGTVDSTVIADDGVCHGIEWFELKENIELKPNAIEMMRSLESGEAFRRDKEETRP